VSDLAPTEIKALARIVDELDYYQLLHLKHGDGAAKVKAAYHATSRAFHPDANRHIVDRELRAAVESIAKRVTEAYSVLRDPRRRQVYDRRLASGSGVRMQLAEAETEASRLAKEQRQGRTPQGRQFFNLASADIRRRDFASAERNLQTALTFEPGNAFFEERLTEVRRELR
jgi:curved DNA-binding protein CbpA